LKTLESAICDILRSEGRGRECTVEIFSRGDTDYYFAYPDDFVQNVITHDDGGELSSRTFRQTLLVVFAYNRTEGSLETFAKLSKKAKEALEVAFAKCVLDWDLGSYDPCASYELNQLKSPSFLLRTDPEDCLQVHLRKMRLSHKNNGRRLFLEVDDEDEIHDAMRECLNLPCMPLSEVNVTLVTFCFEFLPLDGRKPGRQSFDVGYPRSCSLRNARPDRIQVIQKYLKRWGIDRAGTAELALATAGN
jgi:hypothetical protein